MAKEPVVRLELMTGEVVFDLVLSAVALEYAREVLGFMLPAAHFRLFLDDEEISPPFLGPHKEIDLRLDAEGLRLSGGRLPGIGFTQWHQWEKRDSLDGVDLPGVYLLAHFQVGPNGPAEPTAKQIVYIGATDRPLSDRWRNFDRVIAGKAENHSGGKTYRKRFGQRIDDLYVAALPVRLDKKFSWWFTSTSRPSCNGSSSGNGERRRHATVGSRLQIRRRGWPHRKYQR